MGSILSRNGRLSSGYAEPPLRRWIKLVPLLGLLVIGLQVAAGACKRVVAAFREEPAASGLRMASEVAASTPPDLRSREATVTAGDLSLNIVDNSYSPALLSGLQSLWSTREWPHANAFDPQSTTVGGGINFEHVISGHDDFFNRFSPRHGLYALERSSDGSSVRLTRNCEDDPWAISSVMTVTPVAPHFVDLEFRCRFHEPARFGERGYAVFFWANYMNDVEDVPMYFLGVGGPGGSEQWVAGDGQPRPGTTYISADAEALGFDPDHAFPLNLVSRDWPRITRPFFYGRAGYGMVFEMMFDRLHGADDEIRFSNFLYKVVRRSRRPAWDFQYVVRHIEEDREYGFKARIVWKKFVSPEDCLREFESWRQELDEAAQPARQASPTAPVSPLLSGL